MTRGERRTMVGGYKADYLVDQLYMAHLDFNNDEAEEFIFRKHAVGPGLALSESEWRYVFHLCRKIDIVTHWVEY
jgi:predicted ATPase